MRNETRTFLICSLLLAGVWAQSTPPTPRPYKITTLDQINALASRGALNQRGEVIGFATNTTAPPIRLVRFIPFAPNGSTGTQQVLTGTLDYIQTAPMHNELGQVFYANWSTYALARWTPSTPGSTVGQSIDLTPPNSISPMPIIPVNSYGQVATLTAAGPLAVWTPTTPNGATGSLTSSDMYGQPVGLNDSGQLLMVPWTTPLAQDMDAIHIVQSGQAGRTLAQLPRF